jgi:hypothetical protein
MTLLLEQRLIWILEEMDGGKRVQEEGRRQSYTEYLLLTSLGVLTETVDRFAKSIAALP